MCFLLRVKKLAVASLNHAEQVGAIQFLYKQNKKLEASISLEIPITEVRKLWFAEPKTSPNDFPTVRVTLQEPKTVTQLRFFKLQ